MPETITSTLSLRSETRSNGTLEISLWSIPLPLPDPDEIMVELEAAPLHPADISQLLAAADLGSCRRTGTGAEVRIVFQLPPGRLASMASRMDKPLPVGNEGAGVVIRAGSRQQHLIGRKVAIMGGAMLSRHRVVNVRDVLALSEGTTASRGAAALINPLTLLTMIETMRDEGHGALVHTAAASALGQMLNRVCLEEAIPLVNVVRRPEQASLLRSQGAMLVCDSSSASFERDLDEAIAVAGATVAFDAIGGGGIANQILSSMERVCSAGITDYRRYGSSTHKQVYIYGGLDTRPTELGRSYGMAWGLGGWLVFERLSRTAPGSVDAMKARIAAELETTFATSYAAEISLRDLFSQDYLRAISARGTGDKYLIRLDRDVG